MKRFERLRMFIVIILGGLALGLLTWGIGKVYLELVGHSGGVKTQSAQKSNLPTDQGKGAVLVLPKAAFWTCQLGVFKSEENAQACLKQLGELASAGGVISENPWIVGIGLGHSAQELGGLKQSLAQKGVFVVVKRIELPERTFRITGNGSRLTMELLTNVNSLLQNGISPQILAQEQQAWNSLAGSHPPAELVQLHQLYSRLGEQSGPEERCSLGLSLYFQAMRIINDFSGK
ncbi:SPOR domain-containing protein [Desulfosporosinus sp. PR]|uniref:SPOR domain-containing protein n=1 Tax=Candidatus Desulfosporosinus nitrosoreducens TaxID=3401928 RepID=UPI0027E74BFB|nr:SPOR domain-containing protein [Desulfosporosinus sp. PR]MDQ7093849.1 SPOR domain-containing protein [Desulfosporosinus sp. PR]